MTEQRMDISIEAPEGFRAVLALNKVVASNLDRTLFELVKLRASMINGCAFCVDMHTTDALEAGEHVRRITAISAWRESTYFTPAERAALALTDELTRLGEHGVSAETWAGVEEHFEPGTVANLVLAVGVINIWNRIAMSSRLPPAPLLAGSIGPVPVG